MGHFSLGNDLLNVNNRDFDIGIELSPGMDGVCTFIPGRNGGRGDLKILQFPGGNRQNHGFSFSPYHTKRPEDGFKFYRNTGCEHFFFVMCMSPIIDVPIFNLPVGKTKTGFCTHEVYT